MTSSTRRTFTKLGLSCLTFVLGFFSIGEPKLMQAQQPIWCGDSGDSGGGGGGGECYYGAGGGDMC
jgi:hypothetical protein